MNHPPSNHSRHWLWMLVCCLAPVAIILALPLLGIQLTGLLAYAPALVCAGLMLWMMIGMRHGDMPPTPPPAETPAIKDQP